MQLNKTKEEDLQNIIYIRQMVLEAEREKQLNIISDREYQYILSKALASIELMEVRYND